MFNSSICSIWHFYLDTFVLLILYYYSVVFKGDHNESAVLCTKAKTYDVKEAETSNSILLLPELTFPDEDTNIELTSRKVIYFGKLVML